MVCSGDERGLGLRVGGSELGLERSFYWDDEGERIMKVRIFLAATTRLEYNEVVEVPDNITVRQPNALVDQKYDNVDGGKYHSDPEYWERATCYWERED
uniref:Uncharacterized protein n=1 Tax=viral metagenome TaxID=1070528 RepID=A0A6M3LX76_9ZZZZ